MQETTLLIFTGISVQDSSGGVESKYFMEKVQLKSREEGGPVSILCEGHKDRQWLRLCFLERSYGLFQDSVVPRDIHFARTPPSESFTIDLSHTIPKHQTRQSPNPLNSKASLASIMAICTPQVAPPKESPGCLQYLHPGAGVSQDAALQKNPNPNPLHKVHVLWTQPGGPR